MVRSEMDQWKRVSLLCHRDTSIYCDLNLWLRFDGTDKTSTRFLAIEDVYRQPGFSTNTFATMLTYQELAAMFASRSLTVLLGRRIVQLEGNAPVNPRRAYL